MLEFLREWYRWSTLISCVVRRLSRVKSEQSQGGEKKAAGKKLGLARISGSGEVAPRFTRVEQSRVILFDVAGFLFCTWPRVILPFSFSYSLITQQQWSAHSKATKTLASSKKSTKSSSGGRFVPVSPPAGAHAVISARERVHFEEQRRTDLERIYSHLASRDSSARTPQNRSFRSGERSRSTTRPTLRARSSTPSSRKSSRTANPVTPMARESFAVRRTVLRETPWPLRTPVRGKRKGRPAEGSLPSCSRGLLYEPVRRPRQAGNRRRAALLILAEQ